MVFAVRTHMERKKHQASIVHNLLPAQVFQLRFLQEATTKNPQKGEYQWGGFKLGTPPSTDMIDFRRQMHHVQRYSIV